MALTISQQPQELTPAYNDQTIVALSDQIAISDFKYIVTVIVNGDTGNTYREDVLQRPDGYLVFDPKEWVKNYIDHFFEMDADLVLSYPINLATNKSVSVEVNILEYYSGGTGALETLTYEAFDACLTDKSFRNYDFSDYIFGGTSGLYFLSKDINTITPDSRIALSQPLFLHFINNPAALVDSIQIDLRRGGSTIDTVSIASLPTPVNTYDVLQLFVGTQIFTGATPAVGDIVRVDFFDSGLATLLRWSYTVEDICTKYTDYVVYYLDRDGNILSFHFEQKSRINHNKKTNQVKLNKNVLVAGVYGSKSYDREDHVVSTATESTIELNTNWLSQLQITQLKDLFDSPIVYLWDYDTLRSCKVVNNQFEEYQINNEPLNVLNITVDLGITETRQRGI